MGLPRMPHALVHARVRRHGIQLDWLQGPQNMKYVHCLPWNPAFHTNISSDVDMFRIFVAVAESVRSSSMKAVMKESV